MKFYEAKVADIIRSSQRDQTFIDELQDYLISVLKLFGIRNYNRLRKFVPSLATSWYYVLTSVSNLQTLGEEYTGTLRLNASNKIPQRNLQLLWLILYVGGGPLYDRVLNHLEAKVATSSDLRDIAKKQITKYVRFLRDNKHFLIRLHHSIFYISGKYHNVSNRFTGIKYVLLRQWLQDDTASKSFSLLGKVSLIYLVFCLYQNFRNVNYSPTESVSYSSNSGKTCILCVENRKNTAATPCGHLFCWECIFDSLKYQQSCPICREIINPSRIIFLQNYS